MTTPRKYCRSGLLSGSAALMLAALAALPAQAQSVDQKATEATAPVRTEGKKVTPKLRATENEKTDDTVTMDVFEVTQKQDQGYQASNTMSGTRLNSSLEDIASAISVVTKEQLLDTASTDINDIFRYEVGTEGTYQFTDLTLDRGNITDNTSNSPDSATRMRGLGSANTARNNFSSSLPVDSFNIDSVEISRGPNSNVFGLGSSGGSVNLVGSRANLQKDSTTIQGQVDSFDGYRSVLNMNRVLFKGLLAVRYDALYQNKGYDLKPSADRTQRQQIGATFKPFKWTIIRASIEDYKNFNNRPNSVTPKDYISDWVADGKPTWNPLTSTAKVGGVSTVVDFKTYNSTTKEATVMPLGLNTSDSGFYQLPSFYIDNGSVQQWTISASPSTTLDKNSTYFNVSGLQRLLQINANYNRQAATYPLYYVRGITDKSLYDWSSVSLTSPNNSRRQATVSNVEIEQTIVQTQRHLLAMQAGLFKEDITGYDRRPIGTTVQMDVNEYSLDGTPNPYFLRPYIGGSAPTTSKIFRKNDNYRLTTAYQLDLTHEKNWLRWVGKHTFAGYTEYRASEGASLGYTDVMVSNEPWMANNATAFSRNNNTFKTYQRYYVGDANGSNVDYAPLPVNNQLGTFNLKYKNGTTGAWATEDVEIGEYYRANRFSKYFIATYGGVWQSQFLKGRIIPTLGWRHDVRKAREGDSAINPSGATNGFYDMTPMKGYTKNSWDVRKGNTDTEGVVVKPLKWLYVHYNQANSFNPTSLTYNIYGQTMNDPKGETKDYGFTLNLLKGRLYIKYNQYQTFDFGKGSSDINTIVQRALRLDADTSNTDPDLQTWMTGELAKIHADWSTQQLEAEAARLMGVDLDFIDGHMNKTHGDASDSHSHGREIEISYNPNKYWTLRANVTQSKAYNAMMSPLLQQYIDERMPVWTSITSPATGERWWTASQASTTPQAWYTANVLANMKLAIATQGKRRAQTREYRANLVSRYSLAGITNHRYIKNISVNGAVRWESKAAIGYMGGALDSDGVLRSYDPNKPIWEKARYYFDCGASYNFKLFKDRIRTTVRLNVANIFEDGRLQAVASNPDGSPFAYRIIEPRKFTLGVTFNL